MPLPNKVRRVLFQLPNFLTVLRIFLCPLALFLLFQQKTDWAIALFVISGLTDFLDGYLARRWKCVSKLGSLLDPVADKIILISFFTALMFMGFIPAWFTGLVFSVNLLQVIGFFILNLPSTRESVQFRTLKIGKINTFIQYFWVSFLILLALLHVPNTSFLIVFKTTGHVLLALLQIFTFIRYFSHFKVHFGHDFKSFYQR